MVSPRGWVAMAVLTLAGQAVGAAQVLNNQYVTGKYYVRQVALTADTAGAVTQARTLFGSITFDGAGRYSFLGQQVLGSAAPAPLTGSGTYSVDAAGVVSMDNPLRAGVKINARVGPEALLGSSTEATDNTFDLLVAIPAPTRAPSFTGSYWTATLEFPGGAAANVRSAIFSLTPSATAGRFAAI